MWTLLTSVFVASLIGSLHCVGMCGGFVAFYAGDQGDGKHGGAGAHTAYHLGRLLTYTALGALAGLLGAGMNRLGAFAGIQHIAMYLVGLLLILWGFLMLAQQSGYLRFQTRLPAVFQRTVFRAYKTLREQPNHRRALWLGLLTTALPCGWLYAFVLSAASTGDPLRGALVMYAFWAGTVPALLALGLGIRRLSLALGAWIPRLSAISLILIGLFAFSQRVQKTLFPAQHKHHHHHQAPKLQPAYGIDPTLDQPLRKTDNPAPCVPSSPPR
jgi:sulfite exporter TauE/SafE